MRVMKRNMKKGHSFTKEFKQKNGISLTAMKHCVASEDDVYSLVSIYEWQSLPTNHRAEGVHELLA